MVLDLIVGVFAGRRRFLAILTIIGIISSIIVCDLGYMDSQGIERFQGYVDQVEVEAVFSARTWGNYNGSFTSDDIDYIESYPLVTGYERVIEHRYTKINGTPIDVLIPQDEDEDPRYYDYFAEVEEIHYDYYLGIQTTFFDTFPSFIEVVNGSTEIQNRSALVHVNLARILGYSIGMQLTLNVRTQFNDSETNHGFSTAETLNITIAGFFQEGDRDSSAEDDFGTSSRTLQVPWIVMGYDYARAFDINLTNKYDRTYLSEHLYLDMRHDVINYVFPEISGVQLNSITQEVTSNTESGVFEFYLLNVYTSYQNWIQLQRFFLFLVSAPIMIMAILLLALVINHAVSGKVTEINMMMARGALEEQIKRMIYRELFRLGAIGGLLGLGIGWIMGHIILSVKDFLVFDPTQILFSPFSITFSTIGISWGITLVVVMFAGVSSNSMWRPSRISAYPTDRKPPDLYDIEITTPKESSLRIRKLISSVKTSLRLINLKALAVAFTSVLFGLIWYISFVNPLPYLPDLYGYILGLFLFTYLISRLGPLAVRFALERAPQPIQRKRSEYRSLQLMMRLIRRGEEAFGLVFFLSLTITFGFASAVSSATLNLSASDLSYYRVGADIQLTSNYANASLPQDFTSNLTDIPGVADATPLKVVLGDVGTWTNVYLLGINISEYNAISYASGGGLLKDSPERLNFEILEEANDTVIIGYDTLLATGKSLIDTINIGFSVEDAFGRPVETKVVTMDIGAVINSFAGFPHGLFVVMRLEVLMGLTNSSTVNHFLVDVEDGYNATVVAQDIQDRYVINFDQIEVATLLYQSMLDAELVHRLAATTTINFIYSSIFSGLFFGSYILSSFTSKKKDFTILRSIGLSRKQLVTLSVIEIATFILPSIVFGTIFGAIYAYETNLNNLTTLAGGVVGRPRLQFTPFSILLVTAVPVIAALITTLVVSWDYAKTNIPRVLKLDMEMTRAYRLKV